MSSKLEPVIWLRVLVILAYMKGRTENDVMAILPNFLPSMGYQYFLSYGGPSARAELRYKYYRSILNMSPDGSSKQIQRRLYINFQAT